MFRFASKHVAMVAAPLLRWQSSSPMPAPVGSAPSQRPFLATRLLPKFEIFDVRDDPTFGTMTRVSVDGKQLLVSQYPQLGPRKVDPNDLSPQFDIQRRISVRLRHKDLAGIVAVVEDHLPSYRMQNNAYSLQFVKNRSGYSLSGEVHRAASTVHEQWAINFENQFAVTLEHFLQAALTQSFGFQAYHDANSQMQQPQSPSNSRNGAYTGGRNSNRGGNRRANANRNNDRDNSRNGNQTNNSE